MPTSGSLPSTYSRCASMTTTVRSEGGGGGCRGGDLETGGAGRERAAGAALMHDVDDRHLQRTRTAEQPADLGKRRLDADQRQLAVDIFALRVDDDDGRVGERRWHG